MKRLKEIKKEVKNFEYIENEDVQWLIDRIEKLEESAKEVITQFKYNGTSLEKLKRILEEE
jgi:5,10-methylenetetrahydrofolate reductase